MVSFAWKKSPQSSESIEKLILPLSFEQKQIGSPLMYIYLFISIGTNSSGKSSFFIQIFIVSKFKELLKFTQ